MFVAGMVMLAVSLVETLTAASIEARTVTGISAGTTTIKITGDPGTPILARDCVDLNGQLGIVAAGGVGGVSSVHASSSPGLGFSLAYATGDFVTVLTGVHRTGGESGVVMPMELSHELGVQSGSQVFIDGEVMPVAEVASLGQRDQTLGRTVLYPAAPTGVVSACYVQLTPQAFATGVTIVSAHFSGVRALDIRILASQGAFDDPRDLWGDRATRYGWVAAGAILTAFCLFAGRGRRSEYAVYLIVGTRRSTVAAISLLEQQIVLVAAVCSAVAWHAFLAAALRTSWTAYHAGLMAMIRALLVVASGLPLGALWLRWTNLTTVLRERAS